MTFFLSPSLSVTCYPRNLCQLVRSNLDPRPTHPIPGSSYLCQRPCFKLKPVLLYFTNPVSNLVCLLTCTSVVSSIWLKLKIICPLEWIPTILPPTIYSFHRLFTPILPFQFCWNLCLLHNIPTNTDHMTDTALVLTSDNFLFIFPLHPILQPVSSRGCTYSTVI